MSETITVIAGIATAVGVFLAWWQIRRGARQAQTDFEDALAREYRELARHIPTGALLGRELTEEEQEKALPYLYHYIDLSNEQTFQRQVGRVSKVTWTFWREGIRSNLSLPAFRLAWEKVQADSPKSFGELKRLAQSDFKDDPPQWE